VQAPFSDALRLWLLYQTWLGQLLLWLPVTWWVLTWQHHRIARHADSPVSKQDIPALIKVRLVSLLQQINQSSALLGGGCMCAGPMQLGLKLALVPGLPVRWLPLNSMLLVVLLPQTYEIDADAAEKPADQYSTLQEFFTRRLKPGLRPIAAEG
jgi:hypothetical protein